VKIRALKTKTFGVAALSSPTNPERVERGTRVLESMGFRVVMPVDPSKSYGQTGGGFVNSPTEERLKVLYDLLENPEVDAVLAARAAYGSAELLPRLDFGRIARAGKAIIGYSDMTNLVATIPRFAGICSVHGGMLSKEFAEDTPEAEYSRTSLIRLLSDSDYRFSTAVTELKPGSKSEGELVVGNLTVLTALLGTPWSPDLAGKILVVEEIGEAPYRIHRMLMQLLLAGKLEKLAALCFGSMSKCESRFPPALAEMLETFVAEHLSGFDYPVVAGLPCGHEGRNEALPVGMKARVGQGQFAVIESPIE
jgi:muramoyltetrapeptide carboxypeptidase